MNSPNTETARVYFVQHERSFLVTINEVTRPILSRTLFIAETRQYFIDQSESPEDYATLESQIVRKRKK